MDSKTPSITSGKHLTYMGMKAQLKDFIQAYLIAATGLEIDWNPDGVNHGYTYLDLYDLLMTSYVPKILLFQKKILLLEKTKRLVDQGEVSEGIKMVPRMDTSSIVFTTNDTSDSRKARTGAITCTKGFKLEFDLEVPYPGKTNWDFTTIAIFDPKAFTLDQCNNQMENLWNEED